MKRLTHIILSGLLLFAGGVGVSFAAESSVTDAADAVQATCPIMGGKVNKRLFVDQGGKRVYMCCEGCREKIEKDFTKIVAKLDADGVQVADTPVPQSVCPIMGGKINKKLFVDHGGERIYMCCEGCRDEIGKDFAKIAKKIAAEGVTLARTPNPQKVCPVSGKPIDTSLFVDRYGLRINVCSTECQKAVGKNFDKYADALEAKGITLAQTPQPQTVCPILGGKINKKLFVDRDGERIYMCCEGCREKIEKDFTKIASDLESKGVHLNAPHAESSAH